MTDPFPDWLTWLQSHHALGAEELSLSQLQAGDLLVVVTQKTRYALRITEGKHCVMESDRPDRPRGPARINGCTFGQSSSIKPNHLFCGGNLELALDQGRRIHTTTAIRELHLRGSAPSPSS